MELILLPLIVFMVVTMFMGWRRQKKAVQATIDLHSSLQVGDRVHTTSGLEGTITGITDDTVDLEIAPGVVTTWIKMAVRDRVVDDVDEVDEDDEYEDYEDFEDQESTAVELTESPNSKTDN